MERFPEVPGALLQMLLAHEADRSFVTAEMAALQDGPSARTAGSGILGTMIEFAFLSGFMHEDLGPGKLLRIALDLSETPCGPTHERHVSPDREVRGLVVEQHPSRLSGRRGEGAGRAGPIALGAPGIRVVRPSRPDRTDVYPPTRDIEPILRTIQNAPSPTG
jgi:hypothetical protein